jgi:hypothetical protein
MDSTRLHDEAIRVLNDPGILASFAREGGSAAGNTPVVFGQEIRNEIAQSAKVINAAKIKL